MRAAIAAAAVFIAGHAAAQAPWNRTSLTGVSAPLTALGGSSADLGPLTFRGALYLTAPRTAEFGGLSGLEAEPGDSGEVRLQAVTDAGHHLSFTAHFSNAGDLASAQDLTLAPLRDSEGKPFQNKVQGDAEDISFIPETPGVLISFEQDHRIIAYEDPTRPDGAQARVDLPAEARRVRTNAGFEAVAALPGEIVAAGREDGRIWLCPKTPAACRETIQHDAPRGLWSLSGFDALGASGDLIAVYRRPNPFGSFDVRVVWLDVEGFRIRAHELANLRRDAPNIEGIAVLPHAGGWRLLLIGDNGFRERKATALIALDWDPRT